MKLFILGFFAAVSLSVLSNYIWLKSENRLLMKISFIVTNDIFQGNYILFPLTGRCTEKLTRNGITSADYFNCDKFQRLININGSKN